MPRRILIHAGIAETRIAQVLDGTLERYWFEPRFSGGSVACRVGDVVLASVARVLPAINAAFLDIGDVRDGFLAARDAQPRDGNDRSQAKISELVHEGEALLVQVLREATEDKGARVSVEISFAGRFVVFAPSGGRVTLSRKIEDEKERSRLKAIMEPLSAGNDGAGFVVRTAAIGASDEALRADAAYLKNLWDGIDAKANDADPPLTLYREPGLIERVLRDHAGNTIDEIVADDRTALKTAEDYVKAAMPDFAAQTNLYEKKTPLFDEYGIEDALAALDDVEVSLPSGGWISIEPTEALTAIDVNSGRQVSRGDLESTALQANLEASEAIARQLVLRGIAGLIAIDFIPVGDDDFIRVTDRLAQSFTDAGLSPEIARMPRMNLVALTLRRTAQSHTERTTEPCNACGARGRRLSVESVALAALRQAESCAAAAPGQGIAMRVGKDVAAWLEARSKELRAELARCGISALRVFPENNRAHDDFSVETVPAEAKQ